MEPIPGIFDISVVASVLRVSLRLQERVGYLSYLEASMSHLHQGS